jgi:hypothetical protein
MITKQLALAACAMMVLSVGSAYAGPCNTGDKDAGSGPTPGATASITTGSADTKAHPPTDTMNREAGNKAFHPVLWAGVEEQGGCDGVPGSPSR